PLPVLPLVLSQPPLLLSPTPSPSKLLLGLRCDNGFKRGTLRQVLWEAGDAADCPKVMAAASLSTAFSTAAVESRRAQLSVLLGTATPAAATATAAGDAASPACSTGNP
ncbi:hypothetical protein Vafri_283, partial [Volvox africanus]